MFSEDLGKGAFRWTASDSFQPLPALPNETLLAASSTSRGVSADGTRILGTYQTADDFLSCLWDAENGTRPLSDLPADLIEFAVTDVSPDGTRAVGYGRDPTSASFTGMLWVEGVGITFLDRDASFTATSMYADGSILGSDSLAGAVAIWTEETGVAVFLAALGLDIEGWSFDSIQGFVDDGLTFVGSSTSHDFRQRPRTSVV